MRKFTLLALMLVFGISGFAQRTIQKSLINPSVKERYAVKAHTLMVPYQRAAGDTIWYDDFSDTTKWTMYHTGGSSPDSGNPPGDWEIQDTQNSSAGYNTGTITNSTWENGFAIYDADKYGDDTHGEDAYIEYTDTIDCSAYTNVAVLGAQYGRKWSTTKMYVEISTDGTTWDSIEINTNWVKSVKNDNPININISAYAAGKSSVHIRFHYHGGWDYDWCIDDIAIIEGYDYDLVATNWIPNFQDRDNYVTGWFSEMPKHQTSPLALLQVPLYNNGVNELTGLNMQVTINNGTSDVYNQNTTTTASGDTSIASSAVDTLYDDVAFLADSTQFPLTYTINMSVGMNEADQDSSSNVLHTPYQFKVTDSTLRRATAHSTYIGTYRFSGTKSGDVIGTEFYVKNTDTVSSASMFFTPNTTFGNGESVILTLYEPDGNGGWNPIISSDPYDLSADDTLGNMVTIPFKVDGFSEIIQPGYYMAGLESYLDPSTQVIGVYGDNIFPHNYAVSSAISVDGAWYYTSAAVPDIILNFNGNSVGIHNPSSEYDKVSVYPNPANTEIHVDNAEGATISVYNLMGQSVMTVTDANKFNTLNTADLAAGTYIVKVINDNNVKTQKINIVK